MNAPTHSPLTSQQWTSLETHAKRSHEALSSLLVATLIQASQTDDTETQEKLLEMSIRVGDALNSVSGLAYLLHPQPEWTGGDSSEPANHVLREPHLIGMRRLRVLP